MFSTVEQTTEIMAEATTTDWAYQEDDNTARTVACGNDLKRLTVAGDVVAMILNPTVLIVGVVTNTMTIIVLR